MIQFMGLRAPLQVKGVRIDTCRDTTVVVDACLSGVEVVNSKKLKIQVKKQLPSVAIDKTDGIVVGLAWDSRSAQIVTSKSSEMNVTFPVSEVGVLSLPDGKASA
jgi:adenylyl cyclase-associated protein